jgi:hypothetical protein
MKKHIFLSILFACVAMTAFATIRRVNNNPGASTGVNCYTTLQAALTASVDDDIIYVEPSATAYDGPFTITKRLKIIGNGAYLTVNTGLQNNTNVSTFSGGQPYNEAAGGLGWVPNFDFAFGSSGSVLYGLVIPHGVWIRTENITIQRCVVNDIIDIYDGVGAATFQNVNILENSVPRLLILQSINSLTIKNNVIRNDISLNGIVIGRPNGTAINVNGIIENNNVLNNASASLNIKSGVTGSIAVINNIFGYSAGSNIVLSGSGLTSFNNNICSCNTLPSGNSNQNSVDFNTVLLANEAGDPLIKSGSPTINAGYYGSGDDIGALNDGTNRPSFKLGYIPPYPTIYSLTVPATVTSGTLSIGYSTRSNN